MSLIPQQIRERIYKGWHFIVTITTPMVCVYALYDIKEILFSTKRKERYSTKSPENSQSKPVDTVPGNKSTKKETPTSDEKNDPQPKEKRTFKKRKKTKKGITMSTVKTCVDLLKDMVKGMFPKRTDSKTSVTIPTDSKQINLKTTDLQKQESTAKDEGENDLQKQESTAKDEGKNDLQKQESTAKDEGENGSNLDRTGKDPTATKIDLQKQESTAKDEGENDLQKQESTAKDEGENDLQKQESTAKDEGKNGSNLDRTGKDPTATKIDLQKQESTAKDEGENDLPTQVSMSKDDGEIDLQKQESTAKDEGENDEYFIEDYENFNKCTPVLGGRQEGITVFHHSHEVHQVQESGECSHQDLPNQASSAIDEGENGQKDTDNIDADRDDIDNIITARPLKGSTEMDNIETNRDDIENFVTVYWQMFWREEGIPVYALEGGHIKLGKAVHISTKAKWTKNNKPIQSKHIELDLYNLSIADEGFYVCEFGPNNLQLKYLLFVLETEETVCTERNRIVYLGIPKQDVDSLEWTKDGKVIESTYHSQTWLTVPIKSLDDTGLYVCTFGPNHMQLKYRLVVVDRIEEVPRHQMTLLGCFGRKVRHTWLEEFANTQRNVKKITIRCEGRFEEEKGMEITLGPKGLMLQCHIFLPKPIEQVTMFRYENEKYKEDEYMHYYTQVGYIWKPEQSYIIVRLLKTSRISGS